MRFLRAIDPSDVESPPMRTSISSSSGLLHQNSGSFQNTSSISGDSGLECISVQTLLTQGMNLSMFAYFYFIQYFIYLFAF
jgi:hypothetical protein